MNIALYPDCHKAKNGYLFSYVGVKIDSFVRDHLTLR